MASQKTKTWLLIEIKISLRKDIIYYGATVIYLTDVSQINHKYNSRRNVFVDIRDYTC